MCFSLATTTGNAGDICWWLDGNAEVNPLNDFNSNIWSLGIEGCYHPGSGKSLPQCASLDVGQARANWSATAVVPTFAGSTSFIGAVTTSKITTTSTATMTYIPPGVFSCVFVVT
jgi:hypothetical protein